jgi:hypothetical protein
MRFPIGREKYSRPGDQWLNSAMGNDTEQVERKPTGMSHPWNSFRVAMTANTTVTLTATKTKITQQMWYQRGFANPGIQVHNGL